MYKGPVSAGTCDFYFDRPRYATQTTCISVPRRCQDLLSG